MGSKRRLYSPSRHRRRAERVVTCAAIGFFRSPDPTLMPRRLNLQNFPTRMPNQNYTYLRNNVSPSKGLKFNPTSDKIMSQKGNTNI